MCTLTQIMYYLLNAEDRHVFGFLSANDNVTSKSLCPLWFQHCSRCTYPLWPPYSQRKIKFSKILHGTVKTILSLIISLPIITFEYGPILSNCNISYEGKEIDLNFCKIKFFYVFIPKTNNFCNYTYLTTLLVLKVQVLTGKREWHCVLFLQLFLGNTVFTGMQDEVLAWNLVLKYWGHFEFFSIFKLIVTVLLTEPNNISLPLSRSLNTCWVQYEARDFEKCLFLCFHGEE